MKEQEVIKRLNFHKEYARLSSNRVVISETDLETVLSMLKQNSAELAEKNAEIERLNRQIDLMAEEIEKGDIEFTEYCNFKIVCDRNCKGCIVKYFERKATNNG